MRDRSMKRSMESRLWHLLQQLPADDRRRILETLSETQRLALERWVLLGRGKIPKKPQTGSRSRRTGRTGVPGICRHGHAGRIRYDARVSCWPFRLSTRMSSELPVVLKQLELLNGVKRRFVALVQECSWRCGQGSKSMRDFRSQCFMQSVSSELQSRSLDLDVDRGLRFEACVPTHFLLGKRLHSPAFPVTATGLQLGFSAWAALNEAIETEATSRGRRNRFTSVQRHMRPDDLEDIWQKIRHVYFSVWTAAGQNRKRVAAQLSALERDFVHRRSLPKPVLQQQPKQLEDAEQKICKLLQRWSKRANRS